MSENAFLFFPLFDTLHRLEQRFLSHGKLGQIRVRLVHLRKHGR